MRHLIKNRVATVVFVAVVMSLATAAGISAYSTHNEKDSGLFFSTYSHQAGTRVYGCEVCHCKISAFLPGSEDEQLRRSDTQPAPVMGLDRDTLGECGWVRYGAGNLKEGAPFPDADVLLTYEENGEPYPPASVNDRDRLEGSGPLRIVAVQMKAPGIPDLSIRATDACVEKMPAKVHYHRDYEKNADYCVKSVVAVRVNPMPAGTTDIDWPGQVTKAIEEKSIVIFGALKPKLPGV